jgi:hypothetical protein
MYQKKIAFGKDGLPWTHMNYKGAVSYAKGTCPITERLYEKELLFHTLIKPSMKRYDLDDLVSAFYKVWNYRKLLC